jgi:serine phosphatase RsbU (regulator of sigma subunit)
MGGRPEDAPFPATDREAAVFPFAAGARGADRDAWTPFLEPVGLAHGSTLFHQGEHADAMYLVESGELAVILEVEPGVRAPVRHFGPGQLLGEVALYHSEPRTATVEAVGDARLWRLSAARLRELETSHPEMALAMHRYVAATLAERVSFSTHELKEPLARLAHALRGLATSDFGITGWNAPDVARAAKRDDEVGSVAQAMEYLVSRLREYVAELRVATAAREAIEADLRIAGEIQQSLLPPPLDAAQRNRVDFSAFIKPAREAGGDLYDGFFLPDGRFLALVGDVSGKGASAALFMALAAMAVRTLAREVREPGDLLARANSLLCERNRTNQFVTACAVILNPATGEIVWANAGHPLPARLSASGEVTWLEGARCAPLGVFEETRYRTERGVLNPGETLVIYSDGVTEADDPAGRLFGAPRLIEALGGSPATSADAALTRVVAAVHAFAGTAPQADDITVIALRRPA